MTLGLWVGIVSFDMVVLAESYTEAKMIIEECASTEATARFDAMEITDLRLIRAKKDIPQGWKDSCPYFDIETVSQAVAKLLGYATVDEILHPKFAERLEEARIAAPIARDNRTMEIFHLPEVFVPRPQFEVLPEATPPSEKG